MKKILSLIICTFILISCSSVSNDTSSVNTGIFNINITLYNTFFEQFDMTAEEYVEAHNDDGKIKDIKVNDDSVTITMSKNDYNEYMEELKESNDLVINELLSDDIYSFTNIEYDEDYTVFDCFMNGDSVSDLDKLSLFSFWMCGGLYQSFKGENEIKVIVNFYNNNNELIETWDSSENDINSLFE